jgi:hypothetical protein
MSGRLTANQSKSAVSLGFWQSGVPGMYRILEIQLRRTGQHPIPSTPRSGLLIR